MECRNSRKEKVKEKKETETMFFFLHLSSQFLMCISIHKEKSLKKKTITKKGGLQLFTAFVRKQNLITMKMHLQLFLSLSFSSLFLSPSLFLTSAAKCKP